MTSLALVPWMTVAALAPGECIAAVQITAAINPGLDGRTPALLTRKTPASPNAARSMLNMATLPGVPRPYF
jgi:hypothetical protein